MQGAWLLECPNAKCWLYRRFYQERLLEETSSQVFTQGNFSGEVDDGYDILREG